MRLAACWQNLDITSLPHPHFADSGPLPYSLASVSKLYGFTAAPPPGFWCLSWISSVAQAGLKPNQSKKP